MGTTGGDRAQLKDDINRGATPAVIAPPNQIPISIPRAKDLV